MTSSRSSADVAPIIEDPSRQQRPERDKRIFFLNSVHL